MNQPVPQAPAGQTRQKPKTPRKTWLVATYLTSFISAAGAGTYAALEAYFFYVEYKPLADAHRLNEGDSEGCLVGLMAIPVFLGGYAVGGITTFLALVSIGFAIKARSPWGALLAVLANIVLWVVVFRFTAG